MLKNLLRGVYYFGLKRCPACGRRARVKAWGALWPELGQQWELSDQQYAWFDQREGSKCGRCGNSLRTRQLASVIVEVLNRRLGTAHSSLRELCEDSAAAGLVTAEINSTGGLHPFLAKLGRLHFSEYGSLDPSVPSENLLNLSYEDDMFDLVLHSDTLEHVPDCNGALAEVRRVLKPGGLHIFTIPVIWDRDTRVRASMRNGSLTHHLPPSFHGQPSTANEDFLVFYEFGRDIVAIIEKAGFELAIAKDPINPTLVTFVARKP